MGMDTVMGNGFFFFEKAWEVGIQYIIFQNLGHGYGYGYHVKFG